jgi:hypothetical protein
MIGWSINSENDLLRMHDVFRNGNQSYIFGRINIKIHLTARILVGCIVTSEISTKHLVSVVRNF